MLIVKESLWHIYQVDELKKYKWLISQKYNFCKTTHFSLIYRWESTTSINSFERWLNYCILRAEIPHSRNINHYFLIDQNTGNDTLAYYSNKTNYINQNVSRMHC